MATVGTSYTEIFGRSPNSREVLVEADKDNTADIYVKTLLTGVDPSHVEPGGAVVFDDKAVKRGLEVKSASGTQTYRVVY
jgi:hypothetical protein